MYLSIPLRAITVCAALQLDSLRYVVVPVTNNEYD